MQISFRALRKEDLALLHEWLQRPHVRRWWGDHTEYASVERDYLPSIEGGDPTDLYFTLLDGEPRGFVETYLVTDYPEYEAHVCVGPGVAGVDLFIADEALTGRGLGPRILETFVAGIVFARDDVRAVVAAPRCENEPSIRAFEKAGFRRVRITTDPEEPGPHQLMRLDRS